MVVIVGDGDRGTWCDRVKINPVCESGVGDGGVGFLGMDTAWAKVLVNSGTSGAGSRFSSESEGMSEVSDDCCSDSSGAGVVLSHQALLGMAGRLLLGEYSG